MEQELLKKLEKSAENFEAKAATIDSIETQVKGLPEKVKGLETTVGEIKKSTEEIATTKTAVDGITKTVDDIKAANVKRDERDIKNQEAIDILLTAEKDRKKNGAGANGESLKEAFKKSFSEKEEKLKSYKGNRTPVDFQIKVVGDIVAGNFTVSGTQGFLNPSPVLGVGRKPYETRHIRELLRVTPVTGADSIYAVRDAGGEGGPVAVAPGVAKPESDRDYVKLVVPITKIAHYYRIPEEYLEDIAWLADEITAVGMEELLSKEDDMVLNNATGGQFQGLVTATNSTAFSAPASLLAAIDFPNNYDVLVAAWTQLRNAKVAGINGVIVNPADYAAMILSKTTTGEYPFGAPNISIPNVFGIPIFPHTSMTSDKFLMGDFSQVAFAQRAGMTVRFYDQDQDNAIKNLVTVVIEERIAVVGGRADKLVYGDFSDARTAINGGS